MRPPRTPAEMVQAYRDGSLAKPETHRCELSHRRVVNLPDGAQFWSCCVCGNTWETPPKPESPWWLVLGLAAAMFGAALLFAAGYVTAMALRAWGFA